MKHFLDSFLNGEKIDTKDAIRGVCRKCGHYGGLSFCEMGTQICGRCKAFLEERKK